MDVSIIIVNYNTSALVCNCLNSIIRLTTGINYEVIVVDNNSEPKIEKILSPQIPEHLSLNFKYLVLPENLGFGKANNEGLKLASGRNIFFLNPDTILLNNAIKILSDFLDYNPDAGACGGNLFDQNLKPAFSFKRFLPGINWELNELLNYLPQNLLFGKNSYFNHHNNPISVGYITGADLMVKKTVLNQTGAFRNEFFMYFEETDLCFRIKAKGWKIFCVPDAKIQHLEGRSFSPSDSYQSDFKTRLIEESRHIYYSLNRSRLSKILADKIYGLFLLSREKLVRNNLKKNYYSLRKKYFKGN